MNAYSVNNLSQLFEESASQTIEEKLSQMSNKEKYSLAMECFALSGQLFGSTLEPAIRETFERINLTMEILFFHEIHEVNYTYNDDYAKWQSRLEALREIPLFSDSSNFDLMTVAIDIEEIHTKEGEAFLIQGEPVNGVFLLRERAKVYVDDQTEPVTIRRGIFGEEACATDVVNASATVRASKDCTIFYIPREKFVKHTKRIPRLQGQVFQMVVDRAKKDFKEARLLKNYAEEQRRLTQEILDHIGQGSFSINQAGEVQNFSIVAKEYMGRKNLAGAPFADIAFRKDRNALREYYRALNMVFGSNEFDPEVILSLLPNQVTIKKRTFCLFYFFVQDKDGYVMSVFVRMEEITQELQLQAQEAKDKKVNDKMHENIGGFLKMLDELTTCYQLLQNFADTAIEPQQEPESEEIGALMRKLHGAKGLCGQFELEDLRSHIHRMEDALRLMDELSMESQVDFFYSTFEKLEIDYKRVMAFKENLGEDIIAILEGISFSRTNFQKLVDAVHQGDLEHIRPLVLEKVMQPASAIVANWKNDIERLSQQTGKQIQFRLLLQEDFLLPESLVQTLNVELAHLYRNSIDHGIEKPEQRKAQGKAATGLISTRVYQENDHLMLTLSDNGAGIDSEKICALARQNPKLNQKHVEQLIASGKVWRLLFLQGFSSAQEVTKLSGRGVGMDAVETAIHELRGQIVMASQQGRGSSFVIKIPIWELPAEV